MTQRLFNQYLVVLGQASPPAAPCSPSSHFSQTSHGGKKKGKEKKTPRGPDPHRPDVLEMPLGPDDNLEQWVNLSLIWTWRPDKDIQGNGSAGHKNPTSNRSSSLYFFRLSAWECKVIHAPYRHKVINSARAKTREGLHRLKNKPSVWRHALFDVQIWAGLTAAFAIQADNKCIQ